MSRERLGRIPALEDATRASVPSSRAEPPPPPRHRRHRQPRLRRSSTLASLALVGALASLSACGPSGGPGGKTPTGDGILGPLALETFHQDRYAIGGKWFQYSPDGHVLTPYPDSYILRLGDEDPPRYVGLRVISYYDSSTSDSGLFTLGFAYWDGSAWGPEIEWVSPRNVKSTGPLCVDVLAREERDCAGDDWHLNLRTFSSLSTLSRIVVNNAGLFLRSHPGTNEGQVHVAKLAGKETLSGLPNPSSIRDLEDVPRTSWQGSDWDFSRFAANVPEAGLLLGRRFVDEGFVGRDDVYFLVNGRFTLARFQVKPKVDGDPSEGLVFTVSTTPIDRNDDSISTDVDVRTIEVAAPAVGEVVYLSFDSEDLLANPARVGDARWPHAAPANLFWDLALERLDDGALRFVISPASGVLNGTDLLGSQAMTPFEDAWPPLSTEPLE